MFNWVLNMPLRPIFGNFPKNEIYNVFIRISQTFSVF